MIAFDHAALIWWPLRHTSTVLHGVVLAKNDIGLVAWWKMHQRVMMTGCPKIREKAHTVRKSQILSKKSIFRKNDKIVNLNFPAKN